MTHNEPAWHPEDSAWAYRVLLNVASLGFVALVVLTSLVFAVSSMILIMLSAAIGSRIVALIAPRTGDESGRRSDV